MAITIPTTTEVVTLAEVKAGQPIAIGVRDEMAVINQQTSRVFCHSMPTNRIVLSSESNNSLVSLPGSMTTISEGQIRVWGDSARFKLSIEAYKAVVQVSIGGIFIGSATAGAFAFYSGVISLITGATIVDGMASVIIQARNTGGGAYVNHIVVEEVYVKSGDAPTSADPAVDLDYWLKDDEMFQALEPLDSWALQTLDDGVEAMKYLRAPGMLHCFNAYDQKHYLSSLNWRCDGPYMISAPPWSETATVVVSLALETNYGTGSTIDVIVYSEHERFDDVQGRLQSCAVATTTHLKFDDIKLRPAASGAKNQMIYVAFRCNTKDDKVDFTTLIGDYTFQKPWRVHCQDLFSSYVNWTRGIAGVGEGDQSTLTFKQSFSFGNTQAFFDIAAIEGLEIVTTSGADTARQPVLVSPHAGTGHLEAPMFASVIDQAAGIVSQAEFEVVIIMVGVLKGVYIEASASPTTRRRLGFPSDPPSSSLLGEIAGNLNAVSRYLSVQLVTRHASNRNIGDATLSTNNIYKQGHYWFIPVNWTGAAFVPTELEIPLGGDPNDGAVTGLLVDTVYAQIVYMVTSVTSAVINTDNLMAIYFDGETPVTDLAPILPVGGGLDQPSPTIADATLAGVTGTQDPAYGSPAHLYENDYSQQYTWPTDTYQTQCPWLKSPVVATTLPVSFPTKLVLKVDNQGGRKGDKNYLTTTTMIVAGLCVWCGPRRE